jgi:hypothetical protein
VQFVRRIACPHCQILEEGILAAKMKSGIRLYAVPAPSGAHRYAGIITTFCVDGDEPLSLTSPLFAEDLFTRDLIALLSRESFDAHLFDENNYELLGYRARNPAFERFGALAEQITFARFSRESAKALVRHMGDWFGRRTGTDDRDAHPIEFVKPLFPEDIVLFDLAVTDAERGARGATAVIRLPLQTLKRGCHAGNFDDLAGLRLLRRRTGGI